jgi:hypothetical protein
MPNEEYGLLRKKGAPRLKIFAKKEFLREIIVEKLNKLIKIYQQ